MVGGRWSVVGGRWSVVGGSVVVVVAARGQASKHLNSRVCEDPMHCCSPLHDTKFLVKTIHLSCARVTNKSRDDEVQYMKYCSGVYP